MIALTADKKARAILLRLEGQSVHEIGKDLGVSGMAISDFFKRIAAPILPKYGDNVRLNAPQFSPDDKARLVQVLAYTNGNVQMTHEVTKLPKETIEDALAYLATKQPKRHLSTNYPELARWMARTRTTTQTLAPQFGMSGVKFDATLRGFYHMKLAMALRLSEISGLPLRSIYGAYTETIDKEIERTQAIQRQGEAVMAHAREKRKEQQKQETNPAPVNQPPKQIKVVMPPKKRRVAV